MDDVISPDAWVPLAEITRPHGVRGEVRLKLFNSDSDTLLSLDEVLVRFPDGEEQEVSIDSARRADLAILMKLYSVDDRNRAEELRGALICARRSQFPVLENGEFYMCDILDARVMLADSVESGPTELGSVREIRNLPSVDLLVVRSNDGGKDWEIPLVDSYIEKVDFDLGVVTVRTLEGLERA